MTARIPAHVREQQINDLPNISFVRWDCAYTGAFSKAVVRCSVDGFEWAAQVNNLVNNGTGCPQCAGNPRSTAEEIISQINARPGIEFVRWVAGYSNKKSKAICRCYIDGYEWPVQVGVLIAQGTGCPQCSKQRHWAADDRIEQINALPNIEFVRWENGYEGSYSKAVCRCLTDGCEWPAVVNNLVNNGRGCPQCAKSGYNPEALGTLYILRSICGGMIKIGISNNYKRRHAVLKRKTPFNWSCIELLHGDGATIAEFEKELHSFTSPAFFDQPFDGYTEWRKWDDRLPRWIERYRARLARIVAP